MSGFFLRLSRVWDRFVFEGHDPRILPVLRIGFAFVLLVQTLVIWPDAGLWFSDQGILQVSTVKRMVSASCWSLFYVLPADEFTIQVCLGILAINAFLLLLGVFSRVQAAMIFLWLVSFQNRNPMIQDGEDTVFRFFAFVMIWLPLDHCWSVLSLVSSNRSSATSSSSWALRLVQFEITAIYASTALCKIVGETWQNGTALWYVSRMTDNYGRVIPSVLFDNLYVSAFATWTALAIEFSLPIALWFKPTRKVAIIAGIALHIGIELTMNLFLFEWVMILGLLSFVNPSDWGWKENIR